MQSQTAFVLDLDDTLIDNEKVKTLIDNNLEKLSGSDKYTKLLRETYQDVSKEKGFVDYLEISDRLGKTLGLDPKKVLTIFYDTDFKSCLFPSAIELIQYLQTLGEVILFSQGEIALQSHKINKSGVEEVIGLDNVRIIQNKKEQVSQLISELHARGFKSITFIEDRADILDEAYSTDKFVKCYWLRSGRHRDEFPTTSCLTFQSNTLHEIFEYIYQNNTVAELANSIKIKQGITPNQIHQLIIYTNQDKQVAKFTSDIKRFHNKDAFSNWIKNGKYIYTIVDIRDNLLGIVWFSEKSPSIQFDHAENYQFTVAIRIYGEFRGQGLGKQFLNFSIRHFKTTFEYLSADKRGIWVTISNDNIPSVKLHETLKFTKVTKPNDQGKIVMILD